MNPNPNQATAILTTGGIAASCFTSGYPRKWQMGFVRQEEHNLSLEICKEDLRTGKCVKIDHDLDYRPRRRLFIDVHSPVYDECDWYQTEDAFDRFSTTHDPQDYRWVINMEREIQQNEIKLRGAQKEYKITLLTVNHANFYSGSLFKYPVLKIGGNSSTGQELGRIADSVAADILCDDGKDSGVLISNGSGENGKFLPKEEGIRYRINLLNLPKEQEGNDHTQHGPHFILLYGI